MRLLLLAYYFPPDGGPGAQRPISFARHLPSAGVTCTVLTRTAPTQRGKFDPADAAALHSLANECRIVRTPASAVGVDAVCAAMVDAGDQVLRAQCHDAILATMSPFSMWRAAAALADRHALPVVFDLRDPWALDGVSDYRTRWHWRRDRAEMRRMLRRADGVIANTGTAHELFRELQPDLAAERIVTITNGWDASDFAGPMPRVPVGDQLTLLHAGTFLCEPLFAHERPLRRCLAWLRHRPEPIEPSGRTPLPLLGALRRLRRLGATAGTQVRLRSVGMIDPALERCVRESGMADAVELVPYQPHWILVDEMRRADALFLTLHGLPRGHRSRIVPGKTYEYLAAGRPVLAGLPDGDARDLVMTSPRAFVADPCDQDAIADQIVQLHAQWRDGAFCTSTRPPGIDRCERSVLAARLANFLRDTIDRSRTAAPYPAPTRQSSP